jgi:hypothetical protein
VLAAGKVAVTGEDGKEAVTFLVRVKDSLEDPERLVLDL